MSDCFKMSRVAPNKYKTTYNGNKVGTIHASETNDGVWIFTAGWNGAVSSATSLTAAKKAAWRELQAMWNRTGVR